METRLKFFGHPVHPMLIVFPLGLLSMAVLFDILYIITGNADLSTFSFWAMLVGVIGGLAAAVFGLFDFLGLPNHTRAKQIAATHGVGNLIVVLLFIVGLATRWNDHAYSGVLPFIPGLIGAIIAVFTAWLGGELVYRLGVGVDRNAGLNAPNSVEEAGPLKLQPDAGRQALSTGPGSPLGNIESPRPRR